MHDAPTNAGLPSFGRRALDVPGPGPYLAQHPVATIEHTTTTILSNEMKFTRLIICRATTGENYGPPTLYGNDSIHDTHQLIPVVVDDDLRAHIPDVTTTSLARMLATSSTEIALLRVHRRRRHLPPLYSLPLQGSTSVPVLVDDHSRNSSHCHRHSRACRRRTNPSCTSQSRPALETKMPGMGVQFRRNQEEEERVVRYDE
ncbi:hypothetical protein Hypma_007011 [Hypsizygus marmoreus]|uniref:Uncharacterized protein n=1 Tax=Hypsizygus marmoreus TaxID=39966 RepID=A0A369K6T8_HYPMA|nr:hypothetical protein Hypma_007011 [Hypsizygus marmoreus]